jgi:hypothetical protein
MLEPLLGGRETVREKNASHERGARSQPEVSGVMWRTASGELG